VRLISLLIAVGATAVLMVVFVGVASAQEQGATAQLKDPHGNSIGTAQFTQNPAGGVNISLQAQGLEPGEHGIHIHEKGDCSSSDFKSAGEHLNPSSAKHGFDNPQGPHAGDLPNLIVNQDGSASYAATDERVTLAEGEGALLRSGGTSLVIHADPDDQMSDPSGNSGDRVACGVIERSEALPSSGGISVPLLRDTALIGLIGTAGVTLFLWRRALGR
jgi:Cu-Zn family superoxide dismutase